MEGKGKRRGKVMGIYGTAALLMLAAALLGVREAGAVQAAQVAAEEKVVYLTFDDGPSCRTEEILAVLEEKGVLATFFVTAEQEEYLPWIGRIAGAGHAVGAHCFRHDTNRLYGSFDAFREDLEKTSSLNAVTAVVFDFRGYDTLGESFVLLTAISGSMLILRGVRRRGRSAQTEKKEDADNEKEIV